MVILLQMRWAEWAEIRLFTIFRSIDAGSSQYILERRSHMVYSTEVKNMCVVHQGVHHGAAPIPEEAKWVKSREVKDISGYTHGVGWCAPQQGACKLSLNIKEGVIQEALIETIGCSGMTHSAAMACEILPGLTVLEALNTDLVCDAINTAMRELFLQIAYGRSQSAFSEDGLQIGAGLEDLGKGTRSMIGTTYGTLAKGPRYLELTDGYITELGLDENDEIIGYKYVNFGKMMDFIKAGDDANTAFAKAQGSYGRCADAVRFIDPRKQ
jgi:NifU-like protein involved in Fe-S cluster formation